MKASGEISKAPIVGRNIIIVAITFSIALVYYIYSAMVLLYSRQIEYRADWVAAQITSADDFARGLKSYSEYSSFFNKKAYSTQFSYLKKGKRLVNIYLAMTEKYSNPGSKGNYVEQISRKAYRSTYSNSSSGGLFSTHPSLSQRLNALGVEEPEEDSSNDGGAIRLFSDYEELEKQMTGNFNEKLRDTVKN